MVTTLLLSGCIWIGESDLADLRDGDGDGVPVWDDCDDEDPAVGIASRQYEDRDGDGVGGLAVVGCDGSGRVSDGGDCDDDDASLGAPGAWSRDADGDGYAAADDATIACESPGDGWADVTGDDCDDTDPAVHPGAIEACEGGVDEDCDGAIDECELEPDALYTGTWDLQGVGEFPPSLVDLDGDGYDELLICFAWDSTVRVFPGGPGLAGTTWTTDDEAWSLTEAPFGTGAFAAAADLDGDGEIDLAAGTGSSAEGPGSVSIAYGPVGPGRSAVEATLEGAGVGAYTGQRLAMADIDGDGVADLVVGAPGDSRTGALYVVYTDERGVQQLDDVVGFGGGARVSSSSSATPAEIGAAFAVLARGDGEGDALAVGAPGWDGQTGAIFLWKPAGGSVGAISFDANPDVARWVGTESQVAAGMALAAGDLDGDGSVDLVVAAPFADGERPGDGAVYVLYDALSDAGDATLDAAGTKVLAEDCDDPHSVAFGASLVVVSDLDGDGADELAVAAPDRGGAARGYDSGAVYLFTDLGRGTALAAEATARLYGPSTAAGAGESLAVGDLDGDDHADLAVAVPGWRTDVGKPGAIVVLLGVNGW